MATKKQLEEKREFARLLFMQGEQQKIIADKTGVSQQTISAWVEKFGWASQRAAASITRPELVNKLLLSIDKLIEQVNESNDPESFNSLGDKLAKMSMTIERLEKKHLSSMSLTLLWALLSGCNSVLSLTNRSLPNLSKPSIATTICISPNYCNPSSTNHGFCFRNTAFLR